MLIPGLLHLVIDSFEHEAQELERIVADDALTAFDQFEQNSEALPGSMKKLFTAEQLKEMRKNLEEVIRDAPEEIANRKQNAALVRQLKEKHLPLSVWTSSIHKLHA